VSVGVLYSCKCILFISTNKHKKQPPIPTHNHLLTLTHTHTHIHIHNSKEAEERLVNTLIPRTNLVASGYCMYSSSTVLMFSMGDGVHGFTLDPSIGEFVLTHPNVR
jgi:Fructose-1-6-bisphosphatase, N-terminal domain